MQFNRWIRQFLRREEDESLVDSIDFPQMLKMSGYHAFISMIEDPELEIVDFYDFSGPNPFNSPERVGVTWLPWGVGPGQKRIFPLEAYALAHHCVFRRR
jgi:hypothetical protein